ncbi:unnamed protein product [Prunus armeniaca]
MAYCYTLHLPKDATYGRLSRRMLYALRLPEYAAYGQRCVRPIFTPCISIRMQLMGDNPIGCFMPYVSQNARLRGKECMAYCYALHLLKDVAYGRLSRRMLYALHLPKYAA